MFQLLVSISRQELAARQLPAFLMSFLIGTLFYRFGSFALECLAFMATWFALDAITQVLLAQRRGKAAAAATSTAGNPTR